MGRWLDSLVDTSILTPHGFCLAWDPVLLWVHAGADALTALAYFVISYVLLRLVRYRRDLAYPWVFRIFAAFILACGVTHMVGVLLLWEPYYWLAGSMKAAAAALSVTTAILLRPLWPRIMELPSPLQLRRVNEQLAAEIAARDAVANQLRASEARFRAIFESSPDALGLLQQQADGAFRFEAINPAMAELLGRPAEQIKHAALGAVLGEAQGEAAQRRYQDCAAQGGTARFETEQQLHGRRHVLETALVSLRESGDGPVQLLESTRDVTDRHGLESRLLQAQKMEAVGQLAGGVAHDFNNLLQAALINIERAEHATESDPDHVRDMLRSASRILSQGSQLINQLLHVSRRKPLRAERLQIGHILGEITDLLERAAGDAVQMTMVAAPDLWSSMIDPAQFETAVLNLVINARDAMPLGGTLTISSANLRLSAGEAAGLDLEPGEYVSLVLTDTGIGMSREVLARVFEPFFTTKDAGKGSGLGLAQVHSFAKGSGGTITIESEPGAGTSVALYFPRCAPARAAVGTPQHGTPAARPQLSARILLVEDDPRVLNQTRLALQEIGLQVIPARDGEAAMQALRTRGDIQLLLSDVVLAGGISGVEVARGALALHPGLPVLLVSGHAEEVLEKFGAIDEFRLLAKPYKQADLLTLLMQMLGSRALPAAP